MLASVQSLESNMAEINKVEMDEETAMSDNIVHSSPAAPEAQSVLDGLIEEYGIRYGANSRPGGSRSEIDRYPSQAFAPPLGNFLLLVRNGETIAGGAFMSHDDETAEIKRIWTRSDLRRQGLARRIMVELENNAAELGYKRTYLSTGFRQPEAVALYMSLGYRPLFDVSADPVFYRSLPFEKPIGSFAGQLSTLPIRQPAGSPEEAAAEVDAIKAQQSEKIFARLTQWQTQSEQSLGLKEHSL